MYHICQAVDLDLRRAPLDEGRRNDGYSRRRKYIHIRRLCFCFVFFFKAVLLGADGLPPQASALCRRELEWKQAHYLESGLEISFMLSP